MTSTLPNIVPMMRNIVKTDVEALKAVEKCSWGVEGGGRSVAFVAMVKLMLTTKNTSIVQRYWESFVYR